MPVLNEYLHEIGAKDLVISDYVIYYLNLLQYQAKNLKIVRIFC